MQMSHVWALNKHPAEPATSLLPFDFLLVSFALGGSRVGGLRPSLANRRRSAGPSSDLPRLLSWRSDCKLAADTRDGKSPSAGCRATDTSCRGGGLRLPCGRAAPALP